MAADQYEKAGERGVYAEVVVKPVLILIGRCRVWFGEYPQCCDRQPYTAADRGHHQPDAVCGISDRQEEPHLETEQPVAGARQGSEHDGPRSRVGRRRHRGEHFDGQVDGGAAEEPGGEIVP